MSAGQNKPADNSDAEVVITLNEDDGDAICTLANIVHLRNDKLPARIRSSALSKLAAIAKKYECVTAVGRATVQWFDHLYSSPTIDNTWEIVEAAYLLDEPLFFARFSSRWVLQQSLVGRSMSVATSSETQKLGFMLAESQIRAQMSIRNDLDALADTALVAFSSEKKHHIDYPPNMSPDPDEAENGRTPGWCRVDSDAAWEYLGALRDAHIFPSTAWKHDGEGRAASTIGDIVDKTKMFREPEYDDADQCEFCEGVKGLFTRKLDVLRKQHEKRLWGMCLDCYKAGGINPGECRVEHAKQGLQGPSLEADKDGLGINGL